VAGTPSHPRVLIADDHAPTRAALRGELEEAGIVVCAEESTGDGALDAALRERPDLCLLDVSMPGGDGISTAAAIAGRIPGTRVALITATPNAEDALAAARAGADGYLGKDIAPGRLPVVIRAILDGESAYPRRLLGRLLAELRAAA
jgi:two-component system nitrate/nitrite response regulator NarL